MAVGKLAPDCNEDKRQALIVSYVGDGSISLSGKPVERAKTGVWKAAPFIYVLVFADTVSVLGIAGNLVTYTYGSLHLTIAEAANTATNFMGVTYLLPLFWGFLADSHFGRFWIISLSSILTLMGLIVLVLSTALPSLHPAACTSSDENPVCPRATGYELSWFYCGLCLVSIGSAGLKPCMLSMGQDQFDETDPEEMKQGAKFFTGYYLFLNLYSIFCVTVLFYIQSSVSFPWGYGCIVAIYFAGIFIFFLGTPFFRHMRPAGSSITRAAEVLVAALKNFNEPLPEDSRDLYEQRDEKSDVHGIRKIGHTPKLSFLDKAAIIKQRPEASTKWELCTVTQVEDLKCVLQIIPIWFCIILVFTLYAQVMGVGVQQASTLDRRLGPHFTIPAGSAAVSLMLSGLAFIGVYEYFLVPVLQKMTGNPEGLSPLKKMGISLVLAIVAMIVAGLVEERRVQTLQRTGSSPSDIPMSVFWLLPQFAILGWVEILLGVAQLHFLYRETPDSMRSLAVSLTFTTISIGYFVSSALVSTVNKYTESTGGWLADEFNTGGLKKYYYLLAGIMFLDLLVYTIFSRSYTYKKLQAEECYEPDPYDIGQREYLYGGEIGPA